MAAVLSSPALVCRPDEVSPALVQRLRDPGLCSSAAAAQAAAQRLFVGSQQALPADRDATCTSLTVAAAAAGRYQRLPGGCYVTGEPLCGG